ncbi:WD40-repeat-containing domain protein [Cryomyces antarcticus]
MTDGSLGSDHVNYLVFRYLQESGHEGAARALWQDWHRDPDFEDPERFSFAPYVDQRALINLIQGGLWIDRVRASITKDDKQYTFVEVCHSERRRRSSSQDGDYESTGPTLETPGKHGREEVNGVTADELPYAKRVRRSNGGDDQVNGAVMEIDGSAAPEPRLKDTNGLHVGTEPSVSEDSPPVEVLLSTLGLGANKFVQTEKRKQLTTETVYLTLDQLPHKPAVVHTIWSPDVDTATTLLSAGQSICRFWDVPSANESEPSYVDLDVGDRPFDITSACWATSDTLLTAAVQRLPEYMETDSFEVHNFTLDGNNQANPDAENENKNDGVMFALRWNQTSKYLIGISSSDRDGSIHIWDNSDSRAQPSCSEELSTPVLDAAWLAESTFVVCGQNLLRIYDVEQSGAPPPDGVYCTTQLQKDFEWGGSWEKVRHEPVCDVIACMSTERNALGLVTDRGNFELLPFDLDEHGEIKAFDFQPRPPAHKASQPTTCTLATAFDSGLVCIWNVLGSFQCLHRLSMMNPFSNLGVPGYTLAYSPDGLYLAVAGSDVISVWHADAGGLPRAVWTPEEGKWSTGEDVDDAVDQEMDATVPTLDQSLSWDVHGQRLAFGVGKWIAVITFRR